MLYIYLLQAGPQVSGPSFNQHLIILAVIILLAGVIGGYTGYLIEKNKYVVTAPEALASYRAEIRKKLVYFIVTGCSAALLIPLFLSTISSQLMSEAQKDPLKYFVFGGFCLLVAVFSKQFISTLSEKLIKDLKEEVALQATEKAEKVFDEKKDIFSQQVEQQVTKQTSELQEKVSALSIWDELTKLEAQIKHPTNPASPKLEDMQLILDKALKTEDRKLISQVYDRISFLSFTQDGELIESIFEKYKDKVELTPYTWADLAIVNMNKYSAEPRNSFKERSEQYLDNAIKMNETYGTAYALKMYLRLIELNNLTTGSPRIAELQTSIKEIFKQLADLGKLSSQQAYNYIQQNENNSFSVYNKLLREKFANEWIKFEEDGKAK